MPWDGEEKIEITCTEDDHVENLGLEGYTGARMRGLDLEKKEEDRDDVEHIAAETEDIHFAGYGKGGMGDLVGAGISCA